jgi:hypothetical protein
MTYNHAIKIYNGIANLLGQEEAEKFAAKLPLPESAAYKRKFKWAKDVCQYLDSTYTPDQVKRIRLSCACNPAKAEMENTKRLYDEAAGLDEFCANYNQEYSGLHPIWHEGDVLYFAYPTCYCGCVKRVSEALPLTWCLCTLGYAKKLFDYVLECDTAIELIESVKTGGSRCVMKITRK